METFWTVVFVILIVGFVINRFAKAGQQVTGMVRGQGNRSKCQFCGKGLKSHPNKFGYAEHCSKCGRRQPWAEGEVA